MKRFQQVCFAAIVAAVMMAVACTPKEVAEPEASKFITVEDGQFIRNGKPYYFVGTNFWYGAILGSEGEGGNRERLCRELDFMKANGIDNLRILVGGEGENGCEYYFFHNRNDLVLG